MDRLRLGHSAGARLQLKGSLSGRKPSDPISGLLHGRLILALCPQGIADPAPVVHYPPAENLEHVDLSLIDTARQEIDLAAYVLTDWTIIQALTRASNRGVTARIYLYGTQLAERELTKVFQELGETPGIEIRIAAAEFCKTTKHQLPAWSSAAAAPDSEINQHRSEYL
jgi:phosphatidylserine/phosphatidylglycerophosphate/cardiolipin synthase-like enzyme